MGTLYVVATPIGNLEDFSYRGVRILSEVSLILCEDTRKTKILLNRYEINTKMMSYLEWNHTKRIERILVELENSDVAVVSEAGTPAFHDPGSALVKAVVEAGLLVAPVPGPNAVASIVSVAGVTADKFIFLGFLPRKKNERRKMFEALLMNSDPIIFYESPHRVVDSLNIIQEILGDRRLVVGREMTKLYEEIYRGILSEAIKHFSKPRGEFTVLIEGNQKKPGYLLTYLEFSFNNELGYGLQRIAGGSFRGCFYCLDSFLSIRLGYVKGFFDRSRVFYL